MASYREMARAAALKYGIDPNVFERQIQQESSWDPNAKSPAGAVGLAQIMPQYHPNVDPTDPAASLDYAAKLMAGYVQQYGDYGTALAAYNAGPGNVAQYGGVPPFEETQSYVQNILGDQQTGGNPMAGIPDGPEKGRRPYWLSLNEKTGKTEISYKAPPPAQSGGFGQLPGDRWVVPPTLSNAEPDGYEVSYPNGEVWNVPLDGGEPAPLNSTAKQGNAYRAAQELKKTYGPPVKPFQPKLHGGTTDPQLLVEKEPGKFEGQENPTYAPPSNISFSWQDNTLYKVDKDKGTVEAVYTAPKQPTGQLTDYQRWQISQYPQEQEESKRRFDLQEMRERLDREAEDRRNQLTNQRGLFDTMSGARERNLQWQLPQGTKYLPLMEPGGVMSRLLPGVNPMEVVRVPWDQISGEEIWKRTRGMTGG